MFTPDDRSRLRDQLIEKARGDRRVVAAGLVGSAARGQEDRWSDIDLALRLAPGEAAEQVVRDWTSAMYDTHGAIAHTDVWAGPTQYRVFLLPSSLQVDVSWWAHGDFAPRNGPMIVVFGEAGETQASPARSPESLIGMSWLYALHVRSSIARGRHFRALYMLDRMREQVTSLLCLHARLDAEQGRGVDDLPDAMKHRLVAALPAGVETAELARSFAALAELLKEQLEPGTSSADSLRAVLDELVWNTATEGRGGGASASVPGGNCG